MSHASNTLQDIIDSSFDGKKINLANASGLAPRVITKLTQDQAFTPATLTEVCYALLPSDARLLCEAVCRDIIPHEYRNEIHINDGTLTETPAAYQHGPKLDHNSEAIFTRLRELCATEPETRAWLHRIGGWILNDSSISNIHDFDEEEKLKENSSGGETDTAS